MSLLSNRGRFSKSNNNIIKIEDPKQTSSISSIGKNPNSLFNIENKKTKNQNEFNISDNLHDKKPLSKHELYNNKVDDYNKKQDREYDDFNTYKEKFESKKKFNVKLIIAMVIVEIITLVGIVMLGTVIRYSKMTQKVTFDKAAVKNTNIDESTLAVMKGYKTVAIFGVDSRTGSVNSGNNADVNLIVNLNLETGDAELISVYRDLYLSVTDNNSYDKLNSAYSRGGPEAAVKTLNKNFDLNIENFFSFNWKAVADGIELLGGIDLEISKSEFKYMNAFIHETCIATGISAKHPAGNYIKSAGMQHLNGVQSVAYGRLRLMDSDFQRVERQKKVIALCLEKAKQLDIPTLRLIMEAVLPQIAYEFDMNEMLSILKIVKNINIVESCGMPETTNVVTMDMGHAGDCVVPLSLEKAVRKLHQVMFNDDDYTPSTAVKRYSNRIIELRKKYTEENAVKASIKASEEAESIAEALNPVKPKITKSTGSNAKKVASSSNVNKNLPIADYENEPEEDENDVVESETTQLTNNQTEVPNGVTSELPKAVPVTELESSNVSVGEAPSVPNVTPMPTPAPSSSPAPINAPGTGSPQMNVSPQNSFAPGNIAPGNVTPQQNITPQQGMPQGTGGVIVSGPPGSGF